ncbi:hypothetical protein DB30_04193 [Enhygromyxa salina]|uniref:Uncharacterized protein n=1 Tax=Enhygromyxa salina TaxID=215803 RepID=A0A0C2D4W7_9BACT|nr:hypothetical protein DB30_04193 [Enhygromyxa salina]
MLTAAPGGAKIGLADAGLISASHPVLNNDAGFESAAGAAGALT